MAIFTLQGDIALAELVRNASVHFAWGTGLPAWDSIPIAVTVNETALVNEVGRIKPSYTTFVTPDPLGTITAPIVGGVGVERFSVSPTPTNHVYFQFSFDATHASTATIRETGLFIGGTTNPSLPAGQMYFVPSEVVTAGRLAIVERATPLVRSIANNQSYGVVFTV